MPKDIPATCNDCGKKFSIDHDILCTKGDIVMALHDVSTKEWGDLVSHTLTSSEISYGPKINNRTVQVERTGLVDK